MQYTYQMMVLEKLYPQLTWAQMEAICEYWRVFYENPEKYKGKELEKIVFEWLENEGKKVVDRYSNPWR